MPPWRSSLSTRPNASGALALVALLALVVLGGCQVDTTVAVHAGADGSGRVEVTVTLDREAAAEAAGLRLRTDDLAKAGWKVEPPVRTASGGLLLRAVKRFNSPDEAEAVVAEVGAVRGFDLTRERTFLRTRTSVRGALDLRRGAATFSDPALRDKLGGLPFGVDQGRVAPLDQALRFTVESHLLGTTRRWHGRAGQRVAIAATGEQWNVTSLVFSVLTLLALAVCGLTTRKALRARRRSTLLS
jgi:hypothetical protein